MSQVEDRLSKESTTYQCPICYEDKSMNEMTDWSHNHNICKACETEMLKYYTTIKCPVCRKIIYRVRDEEDNGSEYIVLGYFRDQVNQIDNIEEVLYNNQLVRRFWFVNRSTADLERIILRLLLDDINRRQDISSYTDSEGEESEGEESEGEDENNEDGRENEDTGLSFTIRFNNEQLPYIVSPSSNIRTESDGPPSLIIPNDDVDVESFFSDNGVDSVNTTTSTSSLLSVMISSSSSSSDQE